MVAPCNARDLFQEGRAPRGAVDFHLHEHRNAAIDQLEKLREREYLLLLASVAELAQLGRCESCYWAGGVDQPIELEVMKHHRRAVLGRLQVAFDAVVLLNGGAKRRCRILQPALRVVVQAAMGDWPHENRAVEGRASLASRGALDLQR